MNNLITGIIAVLLLIMIFSCCNNDRPARKAEDSFMVSGEYFGQKPPGKKAGLFAPGIMSTGLDELNAAFSPDKKEVIFSVMCVPARQWEWRLIMMKEENGVWTRPEIAEFNEDYSGVDPAWTHDGKRIYFCSNRPKAGNGKPEDNFDIWYTDRTESGWSAPVNAGSPINSEKNEFYPSLTSDGTLYFQSSREGGMGESDIYLSRLRDGKYREVEILPEPINSRGFEGDAFIAPDESYLIVSAERSGNNVGKADLWISFRNPDGSWTDPVNPGTDINSTGGENCPVLSPCGKYLFFTSRQAAYEPDSTRRTYSKIQQAWMSARNAPWLGDIYWVDASFINDIRDSIFEGTK